MVNRYVNIPVAVFGNGTMIPFWMCEIKKDGDCGYQYIYNEEETYNCQEVVWDCKQKEITKAFIIIEKRCEQKIGTKVVVERQFNKMSIEIISDIGWDEENVECYYEKASEYKKYHPEEAIPADTKIVCIKQLKPIFVFQSGRPSVHPVYVKELIDDEAN